MLKSYGNYTYILGVQKRILSDPRLIVLFILAITQKKVPLYTGHRGAVSCHYTQVTEVQFREFDNLMISNFDRQTFSMGKKDVKLY